MTFAKNGTLRVLCGVAILGFAILPTFAGATYTVKPGDSIEKIAHHVSIPPKQLVALNNVRRPERLQIGQVLVLKAKPKAKPKAHVKKLSTKTKRFKTAAKKKTVIASSKAHPSFSNPQLLHQARVNALANAKQNTSEYKSEEGKQLVQTAQTMLGTPYAWAGSTSRGVDCSGLVVRSMALLGKDVPHNAAALATLGRKVSYDELQPGDLVFFHTTSAGISHVGIWVGEKTFIHSSSNRGVVRQKLEGYYAKRLVGARRL